MNWSARWPIAIFPALLTLGILSGCDMMSTPDEPPGGAVSVPRPCTSVGGGCGATSQLCCAGSICKGGVCSNSGICSQENQLCNSAYDCCGTLTCNKNGVCSGLRPQGPGTACQGHSDCDGTLTCRSGICRQ